MGICKYCKSEFKKEWWNQLFCCKECQKANYRELKRYIPCIICGFDKITELHHFQPKFCGGEDSNKNLIPLCPNHHRMIHNERYREEIESIVMVNKPELIKNKLGCNIVIKTLRNEN